MNEETRKLCVQSIDGVEYKINRKADIIRGKLHNAMQEIGTALLHTTKRVEETGIELLCTTRVVDEKSFAFLQMRGIVDETEIDLFHETKEVEETGRCPPKVDDGDEVETAKDIHDEEKRKNKMVTLASTIGMKEEELVVFTVKLMENIFGLARSAYGCGDPYRKNKVNLSKCDGGVLEPEGDGVDGVPLAMRCGDAGGDFEIIESAVSVKIEKLAKIAFFGKSTDKDMIETCYEIVIGVCDMENDAVTKIKWEGLPDKNHPGGMIGHAYDILRCYDWKTKNKTYPLSQCFRNKFQEDADKYLNEANKLRKCAFGRKVKLPATPNADHANCAINCLKVAIDLIQKASKLVDDASKFPNDPPAYKG